VANQFGSLAVPAGNGIGAASSFVNRTARTVAVVGAFAGLVVIEGSVDDVEYLPIATFESASFQTLESLFPFLRVRRSSIEVGDTPGTPVVTVGSTVELTSSAMLPAPVSGTGAGVAVDVSAFLLDGVAVAGDFTEHEVVHVEISHDGVCWAAAVPPSQNPRPYAPGMAARYARQRIVGQVVGGVTPTVGVFGRTIPVCYEDLPLPTLPAINGPGTAIDTSECGADKTVIVGAPGGDVPCRIAVQGSNDGGTTFVTAQTWNTTGVRKLNAVFQQMRIDIAGLAESVPGLCVGIAAPTVSCDLPEEGIGTEEHSNADDLNEFAMSVELTTPGGLIDGDLLIVAIAITFQPNLGTSPSPPEEAVVFPAIPGDWVRVLSDYPEGTGNMPIVEQLRGEDRLAIFSRVVLDASAEPATHTFEWPLTVDPVSFCAFIQPYSTGIVNSSPSIAAAAPQVDQTFNAGNPMDVVAPSLTALEDTERLLCFFVARNGTSVAGGSPFTAPPSMVDLNNPMNLQTSGTADPLGLAAFAEDVPAGPTGTRTATVDQAGAPPNPFRGIAYSLLIAGCPLPEPPPEEEV
jgi:hypothetical protein